MALDPRTFDDLYAAHAARLYSVSVRITGDRGLAEDVVQETFVKAYTASDDIVIENIGAWMSTVARVASGDTMPLMSALTVAVASGCPSW